VKLFSIIICSRNPREDFIRRTLQAIREQTLDNRHWELVIVDSASNPPLEQRGLPVPDGTRFIRVDEPGIARARMNGTFAASGEWIVFVDDDNLLDCNYLEKSLEVIDERPEIALFCGRISPEFQSPPPEWLKLFHRQLAIIDFASDSWAREWDPARIPCWTAGMCIRRHVAMSFFQNVQNDPFVIAIKTRVEDVYLVMETVRKGNEAGLFCRLHLRHLIPTERMTPEYLSRVVAETAYNVTILRRRESTAGIRDFLRPMKQAIMATWKHGISPTGRIMRAAAFSDLQGELDVVFSRFLKRPV